VPSPATAPAEVLAALSRVLSDWGASWYLFGAQAVLVWGRPRLTADIDVTVRLVPEDPPRFVQAMGEHGFQVRVSNADEFVRRTRVLPFVHVPTGLAIDVVLGGPGPEELFLSRAVMVDFGGLTVPVISPEDLIVTKVLAGRPKDWEDVQGVLAERAEWLDLEAIRATLALIEDALGQSDLRPAFEAALARARRGHIGS
jgi:hypothetical protein